MNGLVSFRNPIPTYACIYTYKKETVKVRKLSKLQKSFSEIIYEAAAFGYISPKTIEIHINNYIFIYKCTNILLYLSSGNIFLHFRNCLN